MTRNKLRVILLSLLAIVGFAILFACSQTPTSVPVRTFERAQRMDVACMQLYDPNDNFKPREPLGRTQNECSPVPSTLDGNSFGKQLYAFVTQTSRGELAVVNLSAGFLVDQSRATPGVNFLPVGALPVDVATTPDGKMAFVASAEPNKAAIYGIPTRKLLGDSDSRFPHDPEPLSIGSWPVCALPQKPGALAVVPRRTVAADAGAVAPGAGAAGGELVEEYDLVVVLPGDRTTPAKIVTLDPRPFRRGGLRKGADGKPDYNSDHLANEPATLNDGPVLEPGSLAPCPILAAMELAGDAALPKTFAPGPPWDDGVKYRDGGADLTCLRPTRDPRCGARPCCPDEPASTAPTSDAGAGGADAAAAVDAGPGLVVDAGACENVTPVDAGASPLDLGPLDPPQPVAVARDDQTLYVSDLAVPLVHVIDMANPSQPRELAPLVATSLGDPSRAVKIKELAVSPPTRDYKRYLYAVDQIEGSIIVYDVTDPKTMQRTPLTRPHPELNPFQPEDRISFSSPVVAVAFARHDLPLAQKGGVRTPSAAAGALCNPNRNLDANPLADPGFFYRANSSDPGQDIGPRRLRGIFAFATLSNGQVLTIDVDDWDSPCRRPRELVGPISDVTPGEPAPTGPADLDPYHAPNPHAPGAPDDLTVTNETFFPMASPHTLRSEVLIRDDVTSGPQQPRIQGSPTITANSIILPQVGQGSENTPLIDVRFAKENPQVHVDQDWSLTYEGSLPGFEGVVGILSTDDDHKSLILKADSGRFCSKGVEDWAQGIIRTDSVAAALARKPNAPHLPARAERFTSDYIQLTEELLSPGDDYWNVPQDCWDPRLSTAALRHDTCEHTFGAAGDQSTLRDYPIIEAYDSKLRLGRFYQPPPASKDALPPPREVVFSDPSNTDSLKLMRCCFHNQVKLKVRTGGVWSAVGAAPGGAAGVGFFSHQTTDEAGRCVPSCDPRESLLNGRVFTVPNGVVSADIGRNSALAMRNPMIDVRIIGGADGKTPARDTAYTFTTRGQFKALFIAIGGASISVNPQSMHYIEALGQMAVVDGASQGLVLIDLRAVTVARAPYF